MSQHDASIIKGVATALQLGQSCTPLRPPLRIDAFSAVVLTCLAGAYTIASASATTGQTGIFHHPQSLPVQLPLCRSPWRTRSTLSIFGSVPHLLLEELTVGTVRLSHSPTWSQPQAATFLSMMYGISWIYFWTIDLSKDARFCLLSNISEAYYVTLSGRLALGNHIIITSGVWYPHYELKDWLICAPSLSCSSPL